MPRFSLVVPTIHRTVELERLLTSLQNQKDDFEVILVDQNADDRVTRIVERFADRLPLVHISSRIGAARARNTGLEAASGEIVTFPDDDAWYPPGLLTKVDELLKTFPEFAGFCVRATDDAGRDAGVRWLQRPAVVDRFNIWRTSIEFSMFLHHGALARLRFNEELGPGTGTLWGSGEGTDILLRLLAQGHKVGYEPRLVVHHPSDLSHPPTKEKKLAYARGLGRVLRLNGYRPPVAAVLCFGPMARAAVSLARFDFGGASLNSRVALSRFAGYRSKI